MATPVSNRIKFIIAIVFALLGTTLLWLYAEQLDDEHEALVADQVEVVKAARNIPGGTPLTKDRVTTEKVPRKFLPPNPLLESELNIYLGTPVAVTVEEGAMILTSDFSVVDAGAPRADGPAAADGSERLLIKTAKLQLRATEPTTVSTHLAAIAEESGGFVVRSSARNLEHGGLAELTVRVPARRFTQILNQYRGAATLLSDSVEGVDVSDKFQNLTLQARNQRALETKLLSFVEAAKTVDDAIKLEEKIQKYRMEAERLEGRARRLKAQEPLSTIHVTISAPRPAPPEQEELGMFAPLTDAFDDAGTIVLDFSAMLIRFFAALVPFAIVFGPIGVAVAAVRRRNNAARRREDPPSGDTDLA